MTTGHRAATPCRYETGLLPRAGSTIEPSSDTLAEGCTCSRAAGRRAEVRGVVRDIGGRSTGDVPGHARRTSSRSARRHVNDASSRVRPVRGDGSGTTKHVHARDLVERYVIEPRRRLASYVDPKRLKLPIHPNAVDEHQRLLGEQHATHAAKDGYETRCLRRRSIASR